MCATCGCNYPNLEHAMANAKGNNPMGMPIAPTVTQMLKITMPNSSNGKVLLEVLNTK